MTNRCADDITKYGIEQNRVPQIYPTRRCEICDWAVLRNYCLGGRGIVTLENPETGKHHTYEFRRPNNPEKFAYDTLFIYVLVKECTWMYLGMFNHSNNCFKLTRSSKFGNSSKLVKGARYIVNKITNGSKKSVEPMKFYHEGVCAICGRKLTTPKSIQNGIGPRCKKVLDSRL